MNRSIRFFNKQTHFTHVARSMYRVSIPQQQNDFEYYIEAQSPTGNARYPAAAPAITQTVVIIEKPQHDTEKTSVHK